MAQLSVLADEILTKEEKSEILRVLQYEENIAKWSEDAPKRGAKED